MFCRSGREQRPASPPGRIQQLLQFEPLAGEVDCSAVTVNWDLILVGARDLLAVLGGSAFVWRLVDLYKDRVRVAISHITYHEDGTGGFEGPLLALEIDNSGDHALLLRRKALVDGIFLGYFSRRGRWFKPHIRVRMRLLDGDRTLPPVSSRLLHWRLEGDEMPQARLSFVYWFRLRLKFSNRSRTARAWVPRVGAPEVGPCRYWIGYLLFRFRGFLTSPAKEQKQE